MTVPVGELPEIVSTAQLSELLGLSSQRINQFKKDGIVNSFAMGRWELIPTVNAIIRHYGEVAAGRGDGGALDLPQERAKLAKAQEENTTLKNMQLKGMLLPRDAVDAAVIASFANCRARMLALPGKLAPFAATTDSIAEIQDHFIDGVNEALAELASPETVARVASGIDDAVNIGVASDHEAAAEDDGEPVGGRKQGSVKRSQRGARKVAHKSG